MSEYNGWKNYETWSVHLWLTSDQGTRQYWVEEIKEIQSGIHEHENVISGVWTAAQATRCVTSDRIKRALEDFHPYRGEHLDKEVEPDLYSQLLDGAISEVSFGEIAESLIRIADDTN